MSTACADEAGQLRLVPDRPGHGRSNEPPLCLPSALERGRCPTFGTCHFQHIRSSLVSLGDYHSSCQTPVVVSMPFGRSDWAYSVMISIAPRSLCHITVLQESSRIYFSSDNRRHVYMGRLAWKVAYGWREGGRGGGEGAGGGGRARRGGGGG